jgi:hypothetical protein
MSELKNNDQSDRQDQDPYVQHLYELRADNTRMHDTAVLTLASGALAFSVASAPDKLNGVLICVAWFGWISLLAAVVLILFSFQCGNVAIDKRIESPGSDEGENWRKITTWCGRFAGGALFIGYLCIMIAFGCAKV